MFVHRSEADRSATEFVVQNVRDQIGSFVYPVHRLDRATSGVLLLAKSSEAAALFSEMFAERKIHKTYHALARGYCDDSFTVNRPLVSSKGRGKPAGHPQTIPQDAETHFELLEKFELPFASGQHATTRCSLVEARPVTGRYHQIRRHLAGTSHPIIGDAEHGDTKLNRVFQQHTNVTLLMLVAVKIEFVHPVTDTLTVIACPPAESFSSVIESIRAASSILLCLLVRFASDGGNQSFNDLRDRHCGRVHYCGVVCGFHGRMLTIFVAFVALPQLCIYGVQR